LLDRKHVVKLKLGAGSRVLSYKLKAEL
jgi:hypothetical protein